MQIRSKTRTRTIGTIVWSKRKHTYPVIIVVLPADIRNYLFFFEHVLEGHLVKYNYLECQRTFFYCYKVVSLQGVVAWYATNISIHRDST